MPTSMTATTFNGTAGVEDWRFLLGRIEASFRAGSFEAAAELARGIAAAAEDAGHHPDLDLRYPDQVHVALTTHSAGGVTERDVELARTISALAAESGSASQPLETQGLEVAIDALDIPAVLPFWQAVLGYEQESAVA